MFVVLAIILVRGHRRGRQCLIERCRRDGGAEVPVPTSMEAAPPAYTDRVDEKPHVSSAVESPASAAIQKEPGDDVQEIETVEKSDCGTLMVHWIQWACFCDRAITHIDCSRQCRWQRPRKSRF